MVLLHEITTGWLGGTLVLTGPEMAGSPLAMGVVCAGAVLFFFDPQAVETAMAMTNTSLKFVLMLFM